jgi:hypothetical protein
MLKNPTRLAAIAAALLVPVLACAASSSDYRLETLAKSDCDTTAKTLQVGLDAKDPEALYSAGRLYDEGACVKQDAALATQLLLQAARAGHNDAKLLVAAKVGLGDGAEQDYELAGSLLREARDLPIKVDGDVNNYTLGYAFTALRTMQRDFLYPKALADQRVIGTAEIRFSTKDANFEYGSFRRSANSDQPPVGTRVDRAKAPMTEAISLAGRSALSRMKQPDAAKLSAARVSERLSFGPNESEISLRNTAGSDYSVLRAGGLRLQ